MFLILLGVYSRVGLSNLATGGCTGGAIAHSHLPGCKLPWHHVHRLLPIPLEHAGGKVGPPPPPCVLAPLLYHVTPLCSFPRAMGNMQVCCSGTCMGNKLLLWVTIGLLFSSLFQEEVLCWAYACQSMSTCMPVEVYCEGGRAVAVSSSPSLLQYYIPGVR